MHSSINVLAVAAAACAATSIAPATAIAGPISPTEQWEGQWFNDTFSSSGGFTFDIVTMGTDVTITVDLSGNVFGGPDPDPFTTSATLDGGGNATLSGSSALYTNISGGRTADGTLSVDIEGAGGFFPLVEIRGTWDATDIVASYTIYSDPTGGGQLAVFAEGRLIGELIPAPGSLALLGLGVVPFARRRR